MQATGRIMRSAGITQATIYNTAARYPPHRLSCPICRRSILPTSADSTTNSSRMPFSKLFLQTHRGITTIGSFNSKVLRSVTEVGTRSSFKAVLIVNAAATGGTNADHARPRVHCISTFNTYKSNTIATHALFSSGSTAVAPLSPNTTQDTLASVPAPRMSLV